MTHHFIAKQITELSIRNAEEAYKVQNDFANAFRREAVPMLEKLFDRLFGDDEVVRIEKLEIDLGNISAKDLSAGNFVALLQQKLEEALTVHIHQSEQPVQRLPMPKNHFEQWLYFLEYGSFSWEMPQPKQQQWLRDVLDTLATEVSAINQLTQLLRKNNTAFKRLILQHEAVFLKTIAELFTGQKQDELSPFLKEWQQIRRTIHKKQKTKKTAQTFRETEQIFWTTILEKVILQREKKTSQTLCADYILANITTELISERPLIIQQINKAFPLTTALLKQKNISEYIAENQLNDYTTSSNLSEEEKQSHTKKEAQNNNQPTEKSTITSSGNDKLTKQTRDEISEEKSAQQIEKEKNTSIPQSSNLSEKEKQSFTKNEAQNNNQPTEKSAITSTENNKHTKPQFADPNSRDDNTTTHQHPNNSTTQKPQFTTQQPDNHYIPNAGIVMLHPFLGHLFKKLKLTKGGAFKNTKSTQKAILLLHYLTTQEIKTPEYQLTLPKFLCGVPLNTPIDHYTKLTKKEKEEAENLLQAAIEHWGALGKVSNASLREGFLKREGKLEKTSGGWQLQIEKQTIDILLDQLPWNLSIVKLPQMEDILKVDWR